MALESRGEDIAVKVLVRVEVVAPDAVRLVDRHHLGVLRHRALEVELHARMLLVDECSRRDRTCVGPAVELGCAQEHVTEHAVVVHDAPPAWLDGRFDHA